MTVKRHTAVHIIVTLIVMLSVLIATVGIAFAEVVPDSQKTVSPFIVPDANTSATYIHNGIHKGDTIVHAIDISQWNRVYDWNAVKNAGVEYVLIRLGGRFWGSGNIYFDDNYQSNIQGALNAGLQVGVYFFSQAINPAEAREEARFLIDHIGNYNITLPLIMDFEYGPSGSRLLSANLNRRQATDMVLAFCDEVTNAGYTPMLYANKSMLTSDLYASEIEQVAKIWMAHYTTAASYSGAHYGWQYTDKGTVPGIDGAVDCNFFYIPTSTADPIAPAAPSVSKDDLTGLGDIVRFTDGYSEGTTYGDISARMKDELTAAGHAVAFCDPDGKPLGQGDVLRTNDMAVVFDGQGNICKVHVFVLRGDVNGDGSIDIFDPMDMYLYFNGYLALENGAPIACDFNADGAADIFDPMDIYLYLNR